MQTITQYIILNSSGKPCNTAPIRAEQIAGLLYSMSARQPAEIYTVIEQTVTITETRRVNISGVSNCAKFNASKFN